MIVGMPTPSGPMRKFVDDMTTRKNEPDVLSLSLDHGLLRGDHPRTGARTFAICDDDVNLAAAEAKRLGINLSKRCIVCVKSSNHYQAGINPIASRIIPVATPGAITPDFANIPYKNRSRNYWPAIEDPFA